MENLHYASLNKQGFICTDSNTLLGPEHGYSRLISAPKLTENLIPWPDQVSKMTSRAQLLAMRDSVYEESLSILRSKLGEHHEIDFPERAWNIILGHWAESYSNLLVRKFNEATTISETFQINSASFIDPQTIDMASSDTESFIRKASEPEWISAFESLVWNVVAPSDVKIKLVPHGNDTSSGTVTIIDKPGVVSWLKSFVVLLADEIQRRFLPVPRYFFINTYLPLRTEVFAQVLLGQFPRVRKRFTGKSLPSVDSNLSLRTSLSPETSNSDLLLEIVALTIFLVLPKSFLEGFSNLNEITSKGKYRRNPKVVYTSNNFAYDEFFKVWCAKKICNGSKYVVGQHGNNYGTHSEIKFIERETSDFFLTWGWSMDPEKDIPLFVNRKVRETKLSAPKKDKVLLIQNMLFPSVYLEDSMASYHKYFLEQESFVNLLSPSILEDLEVRLHPSCKVSKFSEISRWQDNPSVKKIDFGQSSIFGLYEESKLVVHSYDSTGILETLASNIPTVAFWESGLEYLLPDARSYYDELVDAKILHLSVDSAAEHINRNFESINEWWMGARVQEARARFVSQYAKTVQKPSRVLSKVLLDI